jgi:hypothetical protein
MPLSSGFESEAANSGHADIYAGRCQAFDFQFRSVLLDDRLVEFAPGLLLKPDQKLLERLRIGATRVARGNAVKDEGGDDLPRARVLFSRAYIHGNAG